MLVLCIDHEPEQADQPEEEEEEEEEKEEEKEAINILDTLPKTFYETLTSAKWKERKETLETLLPHTQSRLVDARYGELISALGKVCRL